jgi:hypothetical protein
MEYKYPQVSGGYRWNMVQRILQTVGIKPTMTGDSSGFTVINFDRELTAPEKTLLDGVMADNPTQPPTLTGTKFVIKDIWSQKATIGTAMGATYRVYYSESVLGSGDINQIEIHFDTNLTTTQRNKVLTAYANLITVK